MIDKFFINKGICKWARTLKLKDLIDKIEQSLYGEEFSLFIGAGLSRDSGYYDWKGLLIEPAYDLGLNDEKEQQDLVFK